MEETIEMINELPNDMPKFKANTNMEVIYCGYCQSTFFQWEAAQAARHLRIEHQVDNPYLRQTDNLSDRIQEKRKVEFKHGDSLLSTGGLHGAYPDQEDQQIWDPVSTMKTKRNNEEEQ